MLAGFGNKSGQVEQGILGVRNRLPRFSTIRLVHCEVEVPIVHHCLGHDWLGLRHTFSEHERAGAMDSLPVSKSKMEEAGICGGELCNV